MLVWPDRAIVDRAIRDWATRYAARRSDVLRLGYFGSYATGTSGVGSDLDLVAIVSSSDEPFDRRPLAWPTELLPVPTDLLVYTNAEWRALLTRGDRFSRVIASDVIWVFERDKPGEADLPAQRV